MPEIRLLRLGCGAVLLIGAALSPAHGEVPYDGWRGLRAEPAYAGRGSDRRLLDDTPRFGQPYTAPPSEAPPAAYGKQRWSGFYLGGHLSGTWGSSVPQNLSADPVRIDGFTGGGQAGYNLHFGPFVAGAETDGSWAGVDGMRLFGGTSTAAGVNLDWMATLRGRLGVAWDNVLIYGTGGIAFAGIDLDVATPTGTSSTRDKLTGIVYGGGVEVKITPQISTRLEALRYNFGDESLGSVAGPLSVGADVTTIRAGINWHFD